MSVTWPSPVGIGLNHFLKSRQQDLKAYCSNIYILFSCCSCNTTAYAASQTAEIGFGEKEAKIDAFGQLQKRSIRFALRQRRRRTAAPQPAQPLAYLRRCIAAATAILLCFRLLTSVTTDYSWCLHYVEKRGYVVYSSSQLFSSLC